MRFVVALTFALVLSLSLIAHADTFALTPRGGTTKVYVLDDWSFAGNNEYVAAYFLDYRSLFAGSQPHWFIDVLETLHETDFAGPSGDLIVDDRILNTRTAYTGSQLYDDVPDRNQDLKHVTFFRGTYQLTAHTPGGTDATLVISESSPVPEPSSLELIGTGLLGLFCFTRNRYFSR